MKLVGRRRYQRQHLLATYGEMAQRMIVDVHRKLTAHLCGHERMRDTLTFEIIVQGRKVQTDVFANDIDGSATSQCRVHIHHTGIKTVTGVCSHLVPRLQVIVAVAPVAEAHQIAVLQLTALRRTRRT